MPLYEYECSACHKRTEKIQKFSDPEITVCPFCSGQLERTITAPAFSFAGGGWYKDGYGSVKPAAASGESGGSATPSASGDNAGSINASASPAAAPTPGASAPSAPATAAPAAAKKD